MAKDVRTGRSDTPLESGGTWAVARLAHFSQCFPSRQHIRIGYAIIRERGPYTLHTQTIPLAQHNSVHPGRNSVRRHFTSGISCADILHPDISQPDGRGGRFNFSGQTYPDPLIAFTRRASAADISDYPDFAQCRGVLLKLPDICH